MDTTGSIDDRHYLHDVIGLGNKLAIRAHRPICGHNGIKLVDVGIHINQSLYDRLMRHKLLPPIDDCVVVEGGVSALSLREDIDRRLAEKPALAKLLDAAIGRGKLAEIVSDIPLSSIASLKLTVAREQRPVIYEHSLDVAIAAAAIASQESASAAWLATAVEAGLFHDIGLLHIPPALVESSRDLTAEELRQLYSHPVIGHLVATKLPDFDPAVAAAVLEHHERNDGSGYPKHLSGSQIGPLGQLLAVAEVAASLLNGPSPGSALGRVSIVLRMNLGKLGSTYCDHLISLASRLEPGGQLPIVAQDVMLGNCLWIAEAIEQWAAIRSELSGKRPLHDPIAVLSDRIDALGHRLADVGFDLQYCQTMDGQPENDPLVRHELSVIAGESIWQLRSIAREAQRRWDQAMGKDFGMPLPLMKWVRHVNAGPPESPYSTG